MNAPESLEIDETVLETPWQEVIPEHVSQSPPHKTTSAQRVGLWALTLDSRNIPCQIIKENTGWHLLVPPEQYLAACSELCTFEELNRDWPPVLPQQRPLVVSVLATLSILIFLAGFHNVTRINHTLFTDLPEWLSIGSARAVMIKDGQWWRAITALTLHSDAAHLLSNLGIGGVFAFLLCRELGSGLGWSLILLSGTLGNLLNAFFQSGSHTSIGASTAVFGTVGMLGALGQLRYRAYLRRRWLLPVAGSLALLAILGSEGKNTDLGAHLFGLISGIGIGFVAEWIISRRGTPGRSLNFLLALLSCIVVVGAWWLAIQFQG